MTQMSDLLLKDKVTFITGAGSGIGAAAAKVAAREGAIVILADRNKDAAESVCSQIDAEKTRLKVVGVDVTDSASVAKAIASVVEAFGRLDCAFNNAGIGPSDIGAVGQSPHEIDEGGWRKMLDVNLTGVWLCLKHEIMAMKPGASIVDTASIAGMTGLPLASPYVAAKHGVIGLTKAAAIDYGKSGIRINAICPGYVETPIIRGASQEKRAALTARKPLNRFAEPVEIAEQAVWLMSERSSYVTGACLAVDGGFLAT